MYQNVCGFVKKRNTKISNEGDLSQSMDIVSKVRFSCLFKSLELEYLILFSHKLLTIWALGLHQAIFSWVELNLEQVSSGLSHT